MIRNILKGLALAWALFMSGCSNDHSLSYTKVNKVVGEYAFDGGTVHKQAVDILFFIDESCSMVQEHQMLSDTLPTIYQDLVGPDFYELEWRVGISSTDPASGIYCGNSYDTGSSPENCYVDYDDPDAYIKLLSLTSLLEGYDLETGLDAAISSVAWDSWFHRDDADLLIIYISDEDDQSSGHHTYEKIMETRKEDPFIVTESSIVFLEDYKRDSSCGPNDDSHYGRRYVEVSEIAVELCDTDNWGLVLDNIKTHLPTLNQKWELSEEVAEPFDSLEVRLNGEIYDHWQYLESENTVYLTKIPDENDFISITYLIANSF